ncbi:MAG: arginine--tRNA ligase [Candidatus Woesearchaeota archaeon]
MSFQEELQEFVKKELKTEIPLEVPPSPELGDFALPCFALAKQMKKAPPIIAKELAGKLKKPAFIEKIECNGPYLNFFLKKTMLAEKTLLDIEYQKDKYGTSDEGKGKTIAVDFSSPNIGKLFHFGHLRSTVVGNSICKLLQSQGYKVLRLNYLGDWGTQFGALIYAYLNWGDKKKMTKCPIKHLLELYVKFHKEAKENPRLEEEAKAWFKKLEDGNTEATKLWAKFRQESLNDFKKIYDTLGIEFDSYEGEAHIAKHTDDAIEVCEKKKITQESEGALVVPLKGFEIPFMLRKNDGATTYAARDLAALLYRINTLKAQKIIYVVGREHCLHFQQLFAVMELLGYNKEMFAHVDFGFYLSPEGGKMATRKGKSIFMEDVLKETIELALKTINEKNPKLKNKEEVARIVAVGALFFGDLMNDRNKDIVFDIHRFLDFEGDTGPYLQYTHARASSIIKKAKEKKLTITTKVKFESLSEPTEKKVITLLSEYPQAVKDSLRQYKPHILAQYLISLGRAFNEFYHSCPCLQETDLEKQKARLLLIEGTRTVLKNGLSLLGITAPEEM